MILVVARGTERWALCDPVMDLASGVIIITLATYHEKGVELKYLEV